MECLNKAEKSEKIRCVMSIAEFRVYLDDERTPPAGWTLVATAQATIELLKSGEVTHLSLDHDLGEDDVGTGYDVLLWVEEQVVLHGFRPPQISLHTANISARRKMELAVQKIRELVGC